MGRALLGTGLPLLAAVLAVGWVGRAAARRWLTAPEVAGERLLAGALVAVAAAILVARGLLAVSAFSPGAAFGALMLLAVGAIVFGRGAPGGERGRLSTESVPAVAVGGLAVMGAFAAALVLPVWQWDAIGYHLPWVSFALREGRVAEEIRTIPYLGTYPHAVEHLYLMVRSFLPSEALVDAAQIPLGLLGAIATTVIAGRLGAGSLAPAAGALWLTLPAVFLQLPTNYVDVGTAAFFLTAVAFVLGSATPARLVLAALALGLYLGAKPSAPLPTLLVFILLAARARRAGRPFLALVGLAGLVLVVGGSSYVGNVLRFGNPSWPVKLSLGPVRLPGLSTVSDLLASGAKAPRPSGVGPLRVLDSWFTFPGQLVFDTRLGGLGPVFWCALAGAAVWFARARGGRGALALVALAALAHPEPSTPRFVLAFPALALAAAAAALGGVPGARVHRIVVAAASITATVALAIAVPGLTFGVPLRDVLAAPASARLPLLDPDGAASKWLALRDTLSPYDVVAFDRSFSMIQLLFRTDLANTLVPIPHVTTADAVAALLAERRVTHLVAGEAEPAGAVVRAHPERFRPLFPCGSERCTVYRLER